MVTFYKGKPLMPKKRFLRLQFIVWIYVIAWISASVWIMMSWENLPLLVRVLIFAFVALMPPSFGELFLKYEKYVADWKNANKLNDGVPK